MTDDRQILFTTSSAEGVLVEAQAGDDAAVERLFQAAREYLQIVARNAIDSDIRGQFSESDLIQETLLAANQGFANFKGKSEQQFVAWLRRIFVNNLLNQYRSIRHTAKRDRSLERSIDGGHVRGDMIATPPGESPSQQAIANEESELLVVALDTLPDDYRRVIELRHREHLSYAQVGDRMGRSADAARMLWYRAFQQLSLTIEEMSAGGVSHDAGERGSG